MKKHISKTKLALFAGVATLAALAPQAQAQSSDALIDKLVDKGILTVDEAKDLRAEADKEALSAAATQIYEACTFQDLTGQRVRKIATALHETEVKIDQLIATFTSRLGIAAVDLAAVAPKRALPEDHGADDGEVRACGPQLPGIAKTLAEIDALMEELG